MNSELVGRSFFLLLSILCLFIAYTSFTNDEVADSIVTLGLAILMYGFFSIPAFYKRMYGKKELVTTSYSKAEMIPTYLAMFLITMGIIMKIVLSAQ